MRYAKCVVAGLLVVSMNSGLAVTIGTYPDTDCQYVLAGEYEALMQFSWSPQKVSNSRTYSFECPKCTEVAAVDPVYKETMIFSGAIKMLHGACAGAFGIQSIKLSGSGVEREMRRLRSATSTQLNDARFVKTLSTITNGLENCFQYGTCVVDGKNCFWGAHLMTRKMGREIVYRGVGRSYFIPLDDDKTIVNVEVMIGVLGCDEHPYADFKCFLPVGEKFVKSIKIKEGSKCRWKLVW